MAENNYQTTPNNEESKYNYKYGKRPLWQWIIIYIAIGGAAYGLIYYFFFYSNGGGGYNYSPTQYPVNNSTQPQSGNYPEGSNMPKTTEPATSNTPSPSNTNNNFMIQNMKVEILKEGTGMGAKTGDTVTVNYTGWLTDGTKFDSSLNPGRTPFQFTLGQNSVIQGWELGVLGMKVGEKRKLTIPPELAYGSSGAGSTIPGNATLIFEIDLLKIN
jgi:FKBP-type peptidyl-prolyl cis-trans isomerase